MRSAVSTGYGLDACPSICRSDHHTLYCIKTASTRMATRYTMMVTAIKTWKTNRVLLRNRKVHDLVGQISPSYVFGCHCLWPSLSNPYQNQSKHHYYFTDWETEDSSLYQIKFIVKFERVYPTDGIKWKRGRHKLAIFDHYTSVCLKDRIWIANTMLHFWFKLMTSDDLERTLCNPLHYTHVSGAHDVNRSTLSAEKNLAKVLCYFLAVQA